MIQVSLRIVRLTYHPYLSQMFTRLPRSDYVITRRVARGKRYKGGGMEAAFPIGKNRKKKESRPFWEKQGSRNAERKIWTISWGRRNIGITAILTGRNENVLWKLRCTVY